MRFPLPEPAPPREGPQPDGEFLQRERLAQIVIRSCLEAGQDVGLEIPGREHDHGRVAAGFRPEPPTDFETARAWKSDVEDDDVVTVLRAQPARVQAIRRMVNLVPEGFQELTDVGCQVPIVFDQQRDHRFSLARVRCIVAAGAITWGAS